MLTNKTYDFLKPVAQYVLPAVGTLYAALSLVWNLPYTEQVVGTIMVIDTVMGVVLDMSKKQYQAILANASLNQPELPGMTEPLPEERKWKLSETTYNVLYSVAQVWLPALGAAYFTLARIWNLPYGPQVVATITAVDTFLGVILAVSTAKLNEAKAPALTTE